MKSIPAVLLLALTACDGGAVSVPDVTADDLSALLDRVEALEAENASLRADVDATTSRVDEVVGALDVDTDGSIEDVGGSRVVMTIDCATAETDQLGWVDTGLHTGRGFPVYAVRSLRPGEDAHVSFENTGWNPMRFPCDPEEPAVYEIITL